MTRQNREQTPLPGRKAEAAAAPRPKAAAETAELRFSSHQPTPAPPDALTVLGFDTRGSDGVFGPRSREIIASGNARTASPTRASVRRKPEAYCARRPSRRRAGRSINNL